MKRIFFLLIALSFVGMSCATIPKPWEIASGDGVVSNQYFKAWIKPASYDSVKEGYRAFLLTVQNKTDDVIVLDWNVSQFIENDRENGGFIFSGVMYSMKDDPKAPDLITANSTFKKYLLPLAHLEDTKQGWQHTPMKQGVNGMLLAVRIGDKLMQEKLTVTLTKK
jgi:hypothetical protein